MKNIKVSGRVEEDIKAVADLLGLTFDEVAKLALAVKTYELRERYLEYDDD